MAERTKLIRARLRKRWTQEEAAGFVGVDPGTYRKWEHGTAMPRISSIQLLCEAFGLDVSALGFGEEETVVVPEAHNSLFAGNDLTMRLLSVAFLSLPYQTM
jgi:transcriptional regulator with XRE-family HTH domain